jgi:hypothetical protein
VLGLLAAVGEPLLGACGARLGARHLGLEARGAARLLVALGLDRLAAAARRLRLAAQVLDARELALERALAGVHVASPALGLAQPREQRRVGHLGGGEEAVPGAEDLDDDVRGAASPRSSAVLRARRLSDEDDPAVEVREVVGLLDEERDLAQARVGLGAARPARAAGAALGGGERRPPRPARPTRRRRVAVPRPRPRRAPGPPPADRRGVVRRGRAAVLLALRASLALLRHGGPPVYAASTSAAASRGRRRETTFETPSSPIDTPYRVSAASIVRF